MNNKIAEELIGILSGITGGIGTVHFMGITWQSAWENLGGLLWVGFVSLFTGAMGAIGAHFVKKYINYRKKSKP